MPQPLPTHSRGIKDGNNRIFQFWFLLCQLNEQFRDQSHMSQTISGPPAIQLVSLEERRGEGEGEGEEEGEKRGSLVGTIVVLDAPLHWAIQLQV